MPKGRKSSLVALTSYTTCLFYIWFMNNVIYCWTLQFVIMCFRNVIGEEDGDVSGRRGGRVRPTGMEGAAGGVGGDVVGHHGLRSECPTRGGRGGKATTGLDFYSRRCDLRRQARRHDLWRRPLCHISRHAIATLDSARDFDAMIHSVSHQSQS